MNQAVIRLVDFREKIHLSIPYRSDATMELIDAIAGNTIMDPDFRTVC